ncbi:DUF1349 domain-containing protein [Spirillospora sp. NPDC047279]|uniref:DUF1349 domain-containing protein n=1 Tax=Spirillospora sp. NPDC047279 TaxID=3155478 RepID=UPI003404662D
MRTLGWDDAAWLNPPQATTTDGTDLIVTTRERTDFWRTTAYGFVHDDGHALLTAFPTESAIEVTFLARFDTVYDQAGLMIRVDEQTWIKAGVELTDGLPHLGAVVTHGRSDWSLSPVPDWNDHLVTIRASRSGDAITLRARTPQSPWRTVRLAPLSPDAPAQAGPYCCSPQSTALQVRFTSFALGPADPTLHTPSG